MADHGSPQRSRFGDPQRCEAVVLMWFVVIRVTVELYRAAMRPVSRIGRRCFGCDFVARTVDKVNGVVGISAVA